MDIDKIVVSNKTSFAKKGFKYFIGQKDTKKNKRLFIFLPKMNAYGKEFDETKYVSFFNKKLRIIKEPVYNGKYLEAKVKCYNGKTNTNFHGNKIPKEVSQFTCLSVILIDSVFRTGKNYYQQVFSEEC